MYGSISTCRHIHIHIHMPGSDGVPYRHMPGSGGADICLDIINVVGILVYLDTYLSLLSIEVTRVLGRGSHVGGDMGT